MLVTMFLLAVAGPNPTRSTGRARPIRRAFRLKTKSIAAKMELSAIRRAEGACTAEAETWPAP